MNTLIVYGGQYGTTKAYAEKFSEMTGFPVVSYEMRKSMIDYERIIYFGALYAGGVKGLKEIVRILPQSIKLVVVTVGLADPSDEGNIRNIRTALGRQLPEQLRSTTLLFHLRGGIDYQKLSLRHKTMMTLLYRKAKGLPRAEKTAEIQTMLETFNTSISFVDYDTLAPILNAVK